MIKSLLAPVLALVTVTALGADKPPPARMYQWVNPASGRTQFSGHPPAWYRSEAGGPRVFVFEKGRLIDDTGVPVSAEHRQLLREQAFGTTAAAEAAQAAAEPASDAAPVPDASAGAAQPEDAPLAAAAPGGTAAEEAGTAVGLAAGAGATPDDTSATIARLKAIIAEWDRARTEQAKTVLETEASLKELLESPAGEALQGSELPDTPAP